jgi:hypothetical protein
LNNLENRAPFGAGGQWPGARDLVDFTEPLDRWALYEQYDQYEQLETKNGKRPPTLRLGWNEFAEHMDKLITERR